MDRTLGMAEALTLAVLASGRYLPLSEVHAELSSQKLCKDLSSGTTYMGVRRMQERELLLGKMRQTKSRDGRARKVWFFQITPKGKDALNQFLRESRIVHQIVDRPA